MSGLRVEALQTAVGGVISFAVPPGECAWIGGPSGSGKSLILRAMADLDPHEGRVFLDGADATGMPGPAWRRLVGMLPAESQWWHDTVGEHFHRDGAGFLSRLGFDADVLQWTVNRLSTGERQRLAMARLLEKGPRALLLDEPTANLDAANTARVETLVRDYREERKVPVIWVGHETDQAERVADRRYELADGILREAPV